MDNLYHDASNKAYEAYKKRWLESEDEAPDHLVWSDAWEAALRYAQAQKLYVWGSISTTSIDLSTGKVVHSEQYPPNEGSTNE